MSFKVSYTSGFNPFEWKDLKCPVCGASEFVSNDHALVFCDKCFAVFEVRTTGGDPGCVIDCFAKEVFALLWECVECEKEEAFFDWQKPVCPENVRHTMKKADGILKLWKRPDRYPESYYLILKLRDHCSGWLGADWAKDYSQQLGVPSQKEWDNFQNEMEIPRPRFGARWAAV